MESEPTILDFVLPVSKENTIIKIKNDLDAIMDNWRISNSNNCTGGKMRSCRGEDIETFVKQCINDISKQLGINLVAKRGDDDKKELKVVTDDNKVIKKMHQVDVHVYLNNVFICVIECKAYLDSCYYVRACDDFMLFKKFNYPVKHYIFTLEDSIDADTKIFTDHITDHICTDIFIMLDGKRSSTKPIYDEKFKKQINQQSLLKFVDFIYDLQHLQHL